MMNWKSFNIKDYEKEAARLAKKLLQAEMKAKKAPKCPHGYPLSNPTTQASSECWNKECRYNG